MYLKLTGIITKKKSGKDYIYISECPELCVATHGDNVEEAKTMLIDAIGGLLKNMTREDIVCRINDIGTKNPEEVIVETKEKDMAIKEVEKALLPFLNRSQDYLDTYINDMNRTPSRYMKDAAGLDILKKIPA